MAFQNKSLRLVSASTQYAEITDASQTGLDVSGNITMEAWIRVDTLSANMTIMAKGNTVSNTRQYQFFVTSAGNLQVNFSDDGSISGGHYVVFATSSAVISVNRWYHVAVTFNISSEACVFYVNGSSVSSSLIFGSTIGASLNNGSSAFELGIRSDGGEPFNGVMALARIWSTVRTSSEIADNRYLTLTSTTGLISQWTLDGVATDSIGSNNLTLNGGAVYIPDVPFSGVNSSDWTSSKFFEAQDAQVTGSTNLTDFPVVIKDAMLPSSFYSGIQTGEGFGTWIMDDTNVKTYHRFESGALTTDSSGNGKTLTNTNTVAEGTGLFGGGADFSTSNTNKQLSVASIGLNLIQSYSVAFRVKLKTEISSGTYELIHIDDPTGRAKLYIQYNYNGGTRRMAVTQDRWVIAGYTATPYNITLGTTDWHTFFVRKYGSTLELWYAHPTNGLILTGSVTSGDLATIGDTNPGDTLYLGSAGGSNYSSVILDDVITMQRKIDEREMFHLAYGGGDIRVTTDSAGVNEVPFEVASLNRGSSKVEIWAKIPTLSYNAATPLYVWWANNRAQAYTKGAAFGQWNVWNNYRAVWHGTTLEDSTFNAYNLTNNNSVTFADGDFGRTFDFGTSNTNKNLTISSNLGITSNTIQMQARVKMRTEIGSGDMEFALQESSTTDVYHALYYKYNSGTRRVGAQRYREGTGEDVFSYEQTALGTTDWHNIYGIANGSNLKFYRDGIEKASNNIGANGSGGGDIFRLGGGLGYPTAYIDEVRVASGAIYTADWVATEENMLNNPDGFLVSPTNITVSDSITVTESVSIQITTEINKSETITVTDTPVVDTSDPQINLSEQLDQENSSGSIGIGFGDTGNGRNYMAQGFIAGKTNVAAIGFRINSKNGSADQGYLVWIDNANANSEPTGTVHVGIGGVTEILNADLQVNTFARYALASQVTLVPGQRYAICFAPWNTSTHAWSSDYNDFQSSVSNPYANGRRVHGDENFTNWSAPDSGNADILFQTYAGGGELVTVSESVKVLLQSDIAVSDSVSVSESATVDIQNSVPVSDSITVSENTNVEIITNVTASDSITVTENTDIDFETNLVTSDTVTTTDTVQAVEINSFINVNDSISVSELVAALIESLVTVSDSVTVSESVALEVIDNDRFVSASDNITVSESSNVTLVSQPTVSDSITTTENVSLEIPTEVITSDSITVTELTSVEIESDNKNVSVSDSITVSESSEVMVLPLVLATENITVSENTSLAVSDPQITTSDSITVTENQSVVVVPLIGVSDSISVSESVNIVVESDIRVSDQITVTEDIALENTRTLSVSDSIAVAEAAQGLVAVNLTTSDSITVTDTPTLEVPVNLSASEQVTVTDQPSLAPIQVDLVASENITVVDAPNVLRIEPDLHISVSDSITVTDTPIQFDIRYVDEVARKLIMVEGRLAYLITGRYGSLPQYIFV